MTHNEPRGHWIREGALAQLSGFVYGSTSVIVGAPFDRTKTLMTCWKEYKQLNMIDTMIRIWKTQGFASFWKGSLWPLFGSGLYRSTQFSVYEAFWTRYGVGGPAWLHKTVPGTHIEHRVVIGGAIASVCRALVECPIELIKTRRQTSQAYRFAEVYTGLGPQIARTCLVMTPYFIIIDCYKRNYPETFDTSIGRFGASASAASFGFALAWPFEVIKNQKQAGTANSNSMIGQLSYIIRTEGTAGLYRGIVPGLIRTFVSNGCSMVAMNWFQRQLTVHGWR